MNVGLETRFYKGAWRHPSITGWIIVQLYSGHFVVKAFSGYSVDTPVSAVAGPLLDIFWLGPAYSIGEFFGWEVALPGDVPWM